MRGRFFLIAVVFCLPLRPQTGDAPEVERARRELERVRVLVDAGALPRKALADAERELVQAEDWRVLRRTLYGSVTVQDLTPEQTEAMLEAASRLVERQRRELDRANTLVEEGALPRSELRVYEEELNDLRQTLELAKQRAQLFSRTRRDGARRGGAATCTGRDPSKSHRTRGAIRGRRRILRRRARGHPESLCQAVRQAPAGQCKRGHGVAPVARLRPPGEGGRRASSGPQGRQVAAEASRENGHPIYRLPPEGPRQVHRSPHSHWDQEPSNPETKRLMPEPSLRVLLPASEIARRVKDLARAIDNDYPDGTLYLIGILKGASVFLADLARAIQRPVRFDFMGTSSYGAERQSSGEVKVTKDLDISIEGAHVLIVEDIVDTGITLTYLMRLLRQRNPKSVKVVTLLDKPERRERPVEADYVGFRIPNEFCRRLWSRLCGGLSGPRGCVCDRGAFLGSCEEGRDLVLDLGEDLIGSPRGVDDFEVVSLSHLIEGLDDAGLVTSEAVVHIGSETHVHSTLPVVEGSTAHYDATDEVFHLGAEIEHHVRYQREAGYVLNPAAV